MHRGPIPDDDHPAGYLPPQVLQKGDDILRMDRMVLAGAIPRAFGRDGADGREMVTPPPLPHDGRVPTGAYGAHDPGQRIAAGLVYAEDACAAVPGPPFEGRPGVLAPASHGGFVALAGAPRRRLWAPADRLEQVGPHGRDGRRRHNPG